jgi:hypothetical protein
MELKMRLGHTDEYLYFWLTAFLNRVLMAREIECHFHDISLINFDDVPDIEPLVLLLSARFQGRNVLRMVTGYF